MESSGWSNTTGFQRNAELLRDRASLFAAHGGRLTLEAAEAIAGAETNDPNLFADLIAEGHAIGLHADAGGAPTDTFERMENKIQERLDGLTRLGIRPTTISGISSHLDWIQAAVNADIEIVSGTVAYALTSLPYENRPAEYADCAGANLCHQAWPEAFEDQLEPWRAASTLTWTTPDPTGATVILPTSGSLICLDEERTSDESLTLCPFTDEDIDAFLDMVDQAYAISVERERRVHLTFTWSFGDSLDESMLTNLLMGVEERSARGEVVWQTADESVAAWESGS